MRRFKVIYEVEVAIDPRKEGTDTEKLSPYEKAYIWTHADSKLLRKYGLTPKGGTEVAEPVIQRITEEK